MIDTIIFDFGDVFINLDKEGAMKKALETFELTSLQSDMIAVNKNYEKGLISTKEFIDFYTSRFPELSSSQLVEIWNYIIKDFPKYRLDFLKKLSVEHHYKLILLSNTNELHIDYVMETVPFYEAFKSQFDAFYLSHEIHQRKPDPEIFNFVLEDNRTQPESCLFIDDTLEHIQSAQQLGIKTWHLDPETEDIIDLFQTQKVRF